MMVRNISDTPHHDMPTHTRTNVWFHAALWVSWTLVVSGFAYFYWQAAVTTQQPVDLVGLSIHTLLVGVIGLIVITRIEMLFDPERFIAQESSGR